MFRVGTTFRGLHAFTVQSRVDPHPGAGFRFRRGPADRPEGPCRAAVIVIRRCGIGRADVNLPRPYGLFFPELKRTSVRKQG